MRGGGDQGLGERAAGCRGGFLKGRARIQRILEKPHFAVHGIERLFSRLRLAQFRELFLKARCHRICAAGHLNSIRGKRTFHDNRCANRGRED